MTKTISMSINDGDLADINTYCTMHNLSRSKFFIQSALEKIQVEHVANGLILISGYLDRNENNVLTEEDKKNLRDLLRCWNTYKE